MAMVTAVLITLLVLLFPLFIGIKVQSLPRGLLIISLLPVAVVILTIIEFLSIGEVSEGGAFMIMVAVIVEVINLLCFVIGRGIRSRQLR